MIACSRAQFHTLLPLITHIHRGFCHVGQAPSISNPKPLLLVLEPRFRLPGTPGVLELLPLVLEQPLLVRQNIATRTTTTNRTRKY